MVLGTARDMEGDWGKYADADVGLLPSVTAKDFARGVCGGDAVGSCVGPGFIAPVADIVDRVGA